MSIFEASFPMYEYPETRDANDKFWEVLGDKLTRLGINSPKGLTRSKETMELWTNRKLLISQTCGYPYRLFLSNKVQLVGTPDMKIDKIPPGYYYSSIVVRRDKDSLAGSGEILAFNDKYSQSGWVAPNLYVKARDIEFAGYFKTGGHWQSAQAVADGKATVTAIDVFTWRLIERFASFSKELRIIDTTVPTPGLPLITAQKHLVDELYHAMSETINEIDNEVLDVLPFKGLVQLTKRDYLEVEGLDENFTD